MDLPRNIFRVFSLRVAQFITWGTLIACVAGVKRGGGRGGGREYGIREGGKGRRSLPSSTPPFFSFPPPLPPPLYTPATQARTLRENWPNPNQVPTIWNAASLTAELCYGITCPKALKTLYLLIILNDLLRTYLWLIYRIPARQSCKTVILRLSFFTGDFPWLNKVFILHYMFRQMLLPSSV